DMIDGLERLRPGSSAMHAKYAALVAPAILRTAKRDRDFIQKLIPFVAEVDFGVDEERKKAAESFDALLEKTVEQQGRAIGEFTTPANVAELMVSLAKPEPADRVYDPCFGMGGLLVRSAWRMRAAARSHGFASWDDVRSNGIFGVELNPTSYVIGLCRVLMVGLEAPGLELGDALERPLPRNRATEGFDVILAAPPWG